MLRAPGLGVAVGPALVVRWEIPVVPERNVAAAEVDGEIGRLRDALAWSRKRVQRVRERALERAGPDEARIFDAQLLMLEDEDILAGVETLIRENHFTAERAFEVKMLEGRDLWTGQAARCCGTSLPDLTDVEIRVLGRLLHRGGTCWDGLTEPCVIVAREITPSLTVQLPRERVVGLVSEEGTRTSHAAILAHSLGIPAVMAARGRAGADTSGDRAGRGRLGGHGAGSIPRRPRCRPRRRATGTAASSTRELERGRGAGRRSRRTACRVVLRANLDLPEELEAAVQLGRRGRRPDADRVPGRRAQPDAHRGRAGGAVPPDRRGVPRPNVVVRTYDLGRRQVPGRVPGAGRRQPVPRLARDPRLPRRAGDLPAADARGAPRRGRTPTSS